jgi:hypothetical protein
VLWLKGANLGAGAYVVTTEILGATALQGLVARGCDVPGHEGWLAIDQVGVLAFMSPQNEGAGQSESAARSPPQFVRPLSKFVLRLGNLAPISPFEFGSRDVVKFAASRPTPQVASVPGLLDYRRDGSGASLLPIAGIQQLNSQNNSDQGVTALNAPNR